MAAQPLSLVDVVLPRIMEILSSRGRVGRVSTFERAGIIRDLKSLAATDAFHASLGSSVLASIEGDEDEAEAHALNAMRLGDKDHAQVVRLFNYSNYGRATKALELAREVMRPGNAFLSASFEATLPAGAVSSITAAVGEATAANHCFPATANASIFVAKAADAALRAAGRTEKELAALIDVAGELLREKRLLWLDAAPAITTLDGSESDESSPGVFYRMRVDLSPREAALLTSELIDRAMKRDLMPVGIGVSFVGTNLAAMVA